MFKRGNLSTLLGIFVLMIGVVAGVILVDEVQDFRNKAKERETRTYTICHKTGEPENEWEEIEVNQDELEGYLNQGDILGDCPTELTAN